jgi:L-ascorbate metabolism protein UlaG (beta-lactamase superfamily)
MKLLFTLGATVLAGLALFVTMQSIPMTPQLTEDTSVPESAGTNVYGVLVDPIEHASMVLTWADTTLYVDPVGEASQYTSKTPPAIVLLTDVHGDHLSVDTLSAIVTPDTVIVAPQAVFDELPETLQKHVHVLKNGENESVQGFAIEAVPMYNVPESPDAFHTKGRGNGYVIDHAGIRVYIAGDTSGTPEMRALTNIDIAFIPMNLPYTMDVDEAADAVIDFAPRTVIPYHYRGTSGLSDVNKFKELVQAAHDNIDVLLLTWY